MTSPIPTNSQFVPRDDASIAEHIAEQYREAGIDPSAAYDSPDMGINDFGGPDAFRV